MALSFSAMATEKQVTKNKMDIPKGRLSTDVRFEDQMVNGKYQNAFEAVSTVENEKDLDDLIGVRKSFKDRLKKTEGMR